MREISPGIYRQAFTYAFPTFVTTLTYRKGERPEDLFLLALPAALLTSKMPKKAALLLSAMFCGISAFFPSLFFVAYGLSVGQLCSTELLWSRNQLKINGLGFTTQVVGFFIAEHVSLPLGMYVFLWVVAACTSVAADPPFSESPDPYFSMRKLICGHLVVCHHHSGSRAREEDEVQDDGESVNGDGNSDYNETSILSQRIEAEHERENAERKRGRKRVHEHIDGRKGRYTKLLHQEYRAYLTRPVCEESQKNDGFSVDALFGATDISNIESGSWLFYGMLLAAENRSLFFLGTILHLMSHTWPAVIGLFFFLNGWCWEWISFFVRVQAKGSVVVHMFYGYLLYLVLCLMKYGEPRVL